VTNDSVATLRLLAKCGSMDLSMLGPIADEMEQLQQVIARCYMRLQCADVPREPWHWEVCTTLDNTGAPSLHAEPGSSKAESDPQSVTEPDGCPTEMAVLKRYWRASHALLPPDGPMPSGCSHPQWKYFETVETLRGGCGFLRCESCGTERMTESRRQKAGGSSDAGA